MSHKSPEIGDICAVTVLWSVGDRRSHLVEVIGFNSYGSHIMKPLNPFASYGKGNGKLSRQDCLNWGIDPKHIGCRYGTWKESQAGDKVFPTAIFRN